ncbi:thioredoxin reductase [Natrarchaeobius sp. A-rgal3]|uniref:thioredoxin reductase n=1 Tax=Natrarchaeobius versutus TaxID=1679078 RepID=UPI00350EF120
MSKENLDSSNYESTRAERSSSDKRSFDVVIVGGGPTGCAVGMFTARAGLVTCILDRGPSSLKHCAFLENYLGYPAGISTDRYLEIIQNQVERAGCVLNSQLVTAVRSESNVFEVETNEGNCVNAERVVCTSKADVSFLEPLDRDGTLLEPYEARFCPHGHERTRFASGVVEDSGKTPIGGLYAAGPLAGVGDQVQISAGHGAMVGRQVVADSRREDGYWDDVAKWFDWCPPKSRGNYSPSQHWRETILEELPKALDEDELVANDHPVSDIIDDVVADTLEMYVSLEQVKKMKREAQYQLAQHLDTEVLRTVYDERIEPDAAPSSI